MRKPRPTAPNHEIELKLAVLAPGLRRQAAAIGRALSPGAPALPAQPLHSIYYDTPDGRLRAIHAALRLRTSGRGSGWTQTLKVAERPGGLVDARQEWDHAVATQALDRLGLPAQVWSRLDRKGRLFEALRPCFSTRFRRTRWLVQDTDGGEVEVALDQGQIRAGERSEALCELELELKAGDRRQLTAIAGRVAHQLGTWPARASKAERGFRLAAGEQAAPLAAHPPRLTSGSPLGQAASAVLAEAYWQFATNLLHLRTSDEVELAHQARVGWRRLRTGLRLFRTIAPAESRPSALALRPLIAALGWLRDVEVARFDVLPGVIDPWAGRSRRRIQLRDDALARVDRARATARAQVLAAMAQPACGAAMLDWVLWIERLGEADGTDASPAIDGAWADGRLRRLRRRLDRAVAEAHSDDQWHRVRILAKRLRYTSEFLAPLLNTRKARAQRRHAIDLQRRIGAGRDRAQAAQLLASLGADDAIVAQLAAARESAR